MNMDQPERKQRLNKMVSYVTKDLTWLCKICQLTFSRKTAAIDHIEGQHLRILSYPCYYCDQFFTCSSRRRNHIHLNHREQNKLAKFLTE